MAVKIRLRRMGAKKAPFYRVVVADSRYPRDGRFIEEIGTYNPLVQPSEIKIDAEKAKKWLDDNQIAYEPRDIKLQNPTLEELTAWYRASGLPLKKFFNTSGLLYKSLDLKNKLPSMSEDEMLKLLASDGMLVKRPLLVGDDFVLVGFKEAEWSATLNK